MQDLQLLIVASLTIFYCLGVLRFEAKSKRLAAPLSLYAGLLIVHFAFPAAMFAFDPAHSFFNADNSDFAAVAMLYVLASFIGFQMGAWFIEYWPAHSFVIMRNSSTEEWRSAKVILIAVVISVIGWLARVHIIQSDAYFQVTRTFQGELEGPFYAWIRFAEMLPLHILLLLAVHVWHPVHIRSTGWVYGYAAVLIAEFSYWIPTGRKEEPILILLLPMMIRYLQRRKLPSVATILSFGVFVIALFPISHFYRWAIESYGGLGQDVFSTAEVGISIMDGATNETFENVFGISIFQSILRRLALIEPVSACLRLIDTGQWQLFLGQSYADGIVGVIPRAIWPSKPDFHYGTEFGHSSGLLENYDSLTSISVTFIGESFLNFAWLGVIPLVLMGAIFTFIYTQMDRTAHKQTWALIYAVTLPTILFCGGTFALYFGGILKTWTLFYFLAILMRSNLKKPGHFLTVV
jgi:hypothetical protein